MTVIPSAENEPHQNSIANSSCGFMLLERSSKNDKTYKSLVARISERTVLFPTSLSSAAEKGLKAVHGSPLHTPFYGQVRNTQLLRITQLPRGPARQTKKQGRY